MTEVHLSITGMHCASCVMRVSQALLTTPGVREAQVNLTDGSAIIYGEGELPLDSLCQKVRELGFQASPATSADSRSTEDELQASQRMREQKRIVLLAVLAVGVPILLLEAVGMWLQHVSHDELRWIRISQALICAVAFYSSVGRPIIYSGWRSLVTRSPNMDTLISLGTVTAFLAGVFGLFGLNTGHAHFHAVGMILAFINVGRYLETKARQGVTSSLSALWQRMPQKALLLADGRLTEINVHQVRIGDRLRVVEDTQIPVDGRIVEGGGVINESVITGEFMPVTKNVGDQVYGGTLMVAGNMTIEAQVLGEASAMGKIIAAVQRAQTSQTRWNCRRRTNPRPHVV